MLQQNLVTCTKYNDYIAYKYEITSEIINKYLPDKLPPFASITPRNIAKRTVVYLTPLLLVSRPQIIDHCKQLSNSITLEDLLEQLLIKQDPNFRYNLVITGNSIYFIETPHSHHLSHHLFCKHATLCNNSKDVRFAGEFWFDENKEFRLNNNSGTYRPLDILLENTIQLFQQLTPRLQFRGTCFRADDLRPSIKNRLLSKIQTKV
ncbi:hypothetical protein I4U23_002116 [Adineta vaga]|nr:hypothetical protein I4U23_002116 [Adineta vaga]